MHANVRSAWHICGGRTGLFRSCHRSGKLSQMRLEDLNHSSPSSKIPSGISRCLIPLPRHSTTLPNMTICSRYMLVMRWSEKVSKHALHFGQGSDSMGNRFWRTIRSESKSRTLYPSCCSRHQGLQGRPNLSPDTRRLRFAGYLGPRSPERLSSLWWREHDYYRLLFSEQVLVVWKLNHFFQFRIRRSIQCVS